MNIFNDKKYNHYVYLTINLINGKQYVGDHTINFREKKYYLGSGKYFNFSKKKYGEQNFFKEILEWFETRQEAFDAQEKYITQFNTLVPNGYNISPKGGLGNCGCFSEKTKQKMRNSLMGKKHSEETKKKIGKTLIGKRKTDETKQRMSKVRTGENNPMYGKHVSEETRNKISNSNIGKIFSKETRNKISKSITGKKRSKETKLKLSESHKGHIPRNKGKFIRINKIN